MRHPIHVVPEALVVWHAQDHGARNSRLAWNADSLMGRPVRLLTPFTAVSRDQACTALLVFNQRHVTASADGLSGVWRAFKS